MSSFADFVHACGLRPEHMGDAGVWHRCPTATHPKKRNGAYKLATSATLGWAIDFAAHTEHLVWTAERGAVAPIADMQAFARAKVAQSELRAAQVRATQAARAFYLECAPLRDGHPYLETHKLDMRGCSGLRVDYEGWLVVPAMRERNVMSVQRISPTGEKLFWSKAPMKGASYCVERRGAPLTVLCEGLATGLAIFAACPLARVVVAFSAGNLAHVPIARRGMVVVAADNDHATEARQGANPGIESAQKAARAIGCGVAVPNGIEGTDWADYLSERIAVRLAARDMRSRETEQSVLRAIQGEMAMHIQRNAAFVHP